MNHLEKIEKSRELQMILSKMLFEALEMGCWHKWIETAPYVEYNCSAEETCTNCGGHIGGEREDTIDRDDIHNPNLFEGWTGFGRVRRAIKANNDWTRESFLHTHRKYYTEDGNFGSVLAFFDDIWGTPIYQLEVLKWKIGAEEAEKVLEGGGE